MYILIELILLIVFLTFLSFFTKDNNILIILGHTIPPVLTSLVSILLGIIIFLPIFLKQRSDYKRKIRTFKKEIKELKQNTQDSPKLLTHDQ